jgi:signal transduction histidine kinase
MGRVAGGLAREMRGPLEAVRVAADRLVQALTPAAGIEAARSLSSIQRATDRADRLLAAVLDFVQRTRPRPTRCSVRRILNLATTQASLPPGVTVHLSLPPGLPPVLVDEWRTVAVFDNLLANAAEAMAAGGTIGVFASLKGRRVAIAVSDTGSGIKPEHRKHLFEPLFTTKAYGVGLGLPIARAFVEDSGGSITVKSEPGRGATFVVTLPTAGAGAAGGVDA